MILHIVPDDKFIDNAYKIFEQAYPNNNEFMIITKKNNLLYIKSTPITTVHPKRLFTKFFIENLSSYEFIVLHTLSSAVEKLILHSDNNKFLWIGWGYDYYKYINKKILLDKTEKLNNKLESKNIYQIKNIIQEIKYFFLYKILYRKNNNIEKVFNKIQYFSPVLEEDYILLKDSFNTFYPKYISWNYGSLEDSFTIEKYYELTGNNILLGNSASYENNHIEAIDLLLNLDIGKREVITPLSYGLEDYKNEILKYGESKLQNNFKPLVDFIDINKYNKIISTCSIVIMNHLRQQAVGNIITMMYFGAKIFLHKDNPVYDFFKKNDAYIFHLDELNNCSINKVLSIAEINTNRKILEKFWSKKIILEKTKYLIKTMNEVK